MKLHEIVNSFDFYTMPNWAKEDEDVIWLARINLRYRQQVINGITQRSWLVRKARLLRKLKERKRNAKT